jgi:uncharacterized membrane protein YuzA (DUF378 family)
MKNRMLLDKVVFFLLLLGGFNWGLVGLFDWNLIGSIFGSLYVITRLIYILVGLAAVYRFVIWARAQVNKR